MSRGFTWLRRADDWIIAEIRKHRPEATINPKKIWLRGCARFTATFDINDRAAPEVVRWIARRAASKFRTFRVGGASLTSSGEATITILACTRVRPSQAFRVSRTPPAYVPSNVQDWRLAVKAANKRQREKAKLEAKRVARVKARRFGRDVY